MAELRTIKPVRIDPVKREQGKPRWDMRDDKNIRYLTFSQSCFEAITKAIAAGTTIDLMVTPPQHDGWAPLLDLPGARGQGGRGGGAGYRGKSTEELAQEARLGVLEQAVRLVIAAELPSKLDEAGLKRQIRDFATDFLGFIQGGAPTRQPASRPAPLPPPAPPSPAPPAAPRQPPGDPEFDRMRQEAEAERRPGPAPAAPPTYSPNDILSLARDAGVNVVSMATQMFSPYVNLNQLSPDQRRMLAEAIRTAKTAS